MAAPWPHLQHKTDGRFADYVVAHLHGGPPRDPYGRSFLGLALLQSGIRDHDDAQLAAAFRALGQAAAHPVRRDRIVFENLALATAYNVASAGLRGDRRFETIRPALESRLRRMTPAQFGGKRPYYNYYLVDSAALVELLASGLKSNVPGSALARRAHTHRLVVDLVNRAIPRIAARYTTTDPDGRLALLSDPPWNPPAYDAFSLALLARIVNGLGPAVGPAPREVMRRAARTLWTLASPSGDVSYYGRSQEQSWTLAMTAYGAAATAALPGTSIADRRRFDALAQRSLTRLRDLYSGGPYGFWITPALGADIDAGIHGLDHYADAASYSGLTLAGLNWALEAMDGAGPVAGTIAADQPGSHRISSGDSAIRVVRTPSLWYVVKQGPGTYNKGIGDYSGDVRYDSGLVALESFAPDGTVTQVLPPRPHTLRPDDRAEPVLVRGRRRARFWGTRLRSLAGGGVALGGGFRAGRRWLRRGVTLRYEPSGCGLRVTIPTHRGDSIEQSLWFRGRPTTDSAGRVMSDRAQVVTLGATPAKPALTTGYASGADVGLVRARMRFRASGQPLVLTFCPRQPGP